MFEGVHPDDPHITDDLQGLHLIGIGRGDGYGSEKEKRYVAGQLEVNFPQTTLAPFRKILEHVKSSKGEGVMLRSSTGEYILKLKSPWYLTQKLVGRLNEEGTKFMFSNPKEFKQARLSELEELHLLVDAITAQLSPEQWKNMGESERLQFTSQVLMQSNPLL